MSTVPLTLLKDFGDRLSPMVVKELRHGLRTRVFTSVLTAFQLCLITVVGCGAIGLEAESIGGVFWGFTLVALLAVLPLRGFATLSWEIKGGTMDMLTLTSIPATRIVFGKWAALFSQSLLLAVSLLPYMVVRYHFGGVEIVREAAGLVLAVLASGLATAAFVAFSSQSSQILRLFLAVGILFLMMPVAFSIYFTAHESSGDQMLWEFFNLSWLEQTGMIGGLLLVSSYGIFTLLALGASRIAPPSENHSTVKRKIHLAVLLLCLAGCCALAFHPEEAAMLWLFLPTLFISLLAGVDVMTEEMSRFPGVVLGSLKKNRPPTLIGRLFYPGWASGVPFFALLALLTVSTFCFWGSRLSHGGFSEVLMVLICAVTAAAVPVCVRINKTNRFANWCVVQIGLGVAGLFISILVAVSRNGELGYLGVVTPLTGLLASLDNYRNDEAIIQTSAMVGLGWLLVAAMLAWRERKVYARLEEEAGLLRPLEPAPVES